MSINSFLEWINQQQSLLWGLGIVSVVMFIGTLIAIPYLVSWIPADYFTRQRDDQNRSNSQHPLLRIIGLLFKNIIGIIFVLAGIAMLVLPGQGILTILIGLTLMNFPGKFELERRIVQQRAVYKTINWIRSKRQRPPLLLPEQ